jgi:hypothetical protein
MLRASRAGDVVNGPVGGKQTTRDARHAKWGTGEAKRWRLPKPSLLVRARAV